MVTLLAPYKCANHSGDNFLTTFFVFLKASGDKSECCFSGYRANKGSKEQPYHICAALFMGQCIKIHPTNVHVRENCYIRLRNGETKNIYHSK